MSEHTYKELVEENRWLRKILTRIIERAEAEVLKKVYGGDDKGAT